MKLTINEPLADRIDAALDAEISHMRRYLIDHYYQLQKDGLVEDAQAEIKAREGALKQWRGKRTRARNGEA